jgi:hypothetical protein
MTKQQYNDNVAYFIAFCVELYKGNTGMKGSHTAILFRDSNLTKFLEENFEPIHTQSPQWILDEINDYLSSRKSQNND